MGPLQVCNYISILSTPAYLVCIILKPKIAVGVPGKVIGWAQETKPGSDVDASLTNVNYITIDNSRPTTEISFPKGQSAPPDKIDEHEPCLLDCSLCPYQLISSNNSNAVPLQTLTEILRNEGASEDEIGEVFFDLLRDSPSLGYIPICVFKEKFASTAKLYTRIDPARLECIEKGDDERLSYVKDCSKKVKRLFSTLHQFKSSFENKVIQKITVSA